MNILITIVAFLVALGVLIVVHEYGHYIVARLCDVKVLRFSVGFGRTLALWRLGRDRTEWVIAAIPFGGYVKMLDEREGPVEPEEVHRAFNRKSVWRRIAIVVAGPLFNFVLAVLIYAGLFMYGLPEPRPIIGAPPAGTLAAGAGFASGDTIRAINGEAVTSWSDVRWLVLQAALQRQSVQLETINERGHIASATLDFRDFPSQEVESDVMERIGLKLFRPMLDPVVGTLESGPGKNAGLQLGDRITQIDGVPTRSWGEVVRAIQQNPGKQIVLTVEREGRQLSIPVVPEARRSGGKTIGRLGVGARDIDKFYVEVRYDFVTSLGKGLSKTAEVSIFSLKMLGLMIAGQVSLKNLSGPITIADVAGQAAQMGLTYYIGVIGLLSVSLGVLNLLPIPLLDGGHLMYYVIEAVKGRPVSERAMEVGQRIGLALLLLLMSVAIYNDISTRVVGWLSG